MLSGHTLQKRDRFGTIYPYLIHAADVLDRGIVIFFGG